MKSNMILKGAVSLALASTAFGGVANAASNAPGVDNILRVGGATATDRSLARGWLLEMCDAAATSAAPLATAGYNVEVFTTNVDFLDLVLAGNNTTRNYAIACTLKSTANGAAASQPVVMSKYAGGSSTGVTNVANASGLNSGTSANWVNFGTCRDAGGNLAPGAARTEIAAAGGFPNMVIYTSCPNEGTQTPRAGVSDLEPRLIVNGGASLPLTTVAGASVPMGVAVSSNFAAALAKAQGLTDASGNSCISTDASGNEILPMSKYTPECTPNLSFPQLAGFYTGNIINVSAFEDSNGTAIPNAPNVTQGGSVKFCRRGTGSGTHRSHAVFFLQEYCITPGRATANALTFSGGTTYVDGNTSRVFAGTGASDVQLCLDDQVAQQRYAIGQLSLEANNFNDTDQRWRFVKIDGVFPSLEQVVRGEYRFFVDSACNRANSGLSTVQAALASGTVDGSGNAVGLCGALRGETVAVNPSGGFQWLLGTLNTPALAAQADDPTPATVWTTSDVQANPTNTAIKSTGYGSAPNNCLLPWTTRTLSVAKDDNDRR